jgi:hypothetical protein
MLLQCGRFAGHSPVNLTPAQPTPGSLATKDEGRCIGSGLPKQLAEQRSGLAIPES